MQYSQYMLFTQKKTEALINLYKVQLERGEKKPLPCLGQESGPCFHCITLTGTGHHMGPLHSDHPTIITIVKLRVCFTKFNCVCLWMYMDVCKCKCICQDDRQTNDHMMSNTNVALDQTRQMQIRISYSVYSK